VTCTWPMDPLRHLEVAGTAPEDLVQLDETETRATSSIESAPSPAASFPSPEGAIPYPATAGHTAKCETPLVYVERVLEEKGINAQTQAKYRATMKYLEDLVGRKSISQYTRDDLIKFKDLLLKLPARATTARKFNSPSEALEWNLARPADQRHKTLSAKTINDSYLCYLRSVFQYAYDNGHVDSMIAERVRVAQSATARRRDDPRNRRRPFSDEKLAKIFRQPLFLGAKSQDRLFDPGDYIDWSWRFWLPLFMLYMGVRPNELGQVEVTDFIEREGHPCLSVRTESDADDLGLEADDEKNVKTPAGTREVPVHPVLLRLGILDRVRLMRQSKVVRVFPEWEAQGPAGYKRYSNTSSAFFNRNEVSAKRLGFLARAGVKSEKIALYSFRHNFMDAMIRAGLTDGEQDLLIGHAGDRVARIYTSNEAYSLLIEKAHTVHFEAIDLDALFKARGKKVD